MVAKWQSQRKLWDYPETAGLYQEYCCISCVPYVLCHGHCCFTYCMLCTATYIVLWASLLYAKVQHRCFICCIMQALCHGHCCFICYVLCTAKSIVLRAFPLHAMGTVASYVACCVPATCFWHGHCYFLLLYNVYCHMFVPWTLLLHILHAVYCHIFVWWALPFPIIGSCVLPCTVGTAVLCRGHCCLIFCILCSAACSCTMDTNASYYCMVCTAIYYGHCGFIWQICCCFIFVCCVPPHVMC